LVSAFADPFERYLSPDTQGGTSGMAEQSNAGVGENVPGGVEHDPEHDAATDEPGLCSAPCSTLGGTVSSNKDGPCSTVPRVPGKEIGEHEEEARPRRSFGL